MSCRYCVKNKKEKNFPNKIYYVTSDGLNCLPSAEKQVHIILDENIHQRLDKPNLPNHYKSLLDWIDDRDGDGLTVSGTSVALEHTHSTEDRWPRYCLNVLRDINAMVLKKNDAPLLTVKSYVSHHPAEAVHLTAIQVLIAMTEIAWVRVKLQQNNASSNAFENALSFIQWRKQTFEKVDIYASTIICVASLVGNAEAQDCLKLNKKCDDTRGALLKNAAFDGIHLNEYLTTAVTGRSSVYPVVAVFVTADKALGTFLKNQKIVAIGNSSALTFQFPMPWLKSKEKSSRVLKELNELQKGTKVHSLKKLGDTANKAMLSIAGREVPEFKKLWKRLAQEL